MQVCVWRKGVGGAKQCCCFQFLGLFIMACPKVFVRVCDSKAMTTHAEMGPAK